VKQTSTGNKPAAIIFLNLTKHDAPGGVPAAKDDGESTFGFKTSLERTHGQKALQKI
jgi:hypothetical protein